MGPWTQLLAPPQVSNLKAILQSLVEYSKDLSNCINGFSGFGWEEQRKILEPLISLPPAHPQVLGHPILEQHLPDVSLIGEFSDPEELGKLLQLVLGCAISCEKKQGMGE